MDNRCETVALVVRSVRREHGRAVLTLSNGETLVMPRALLRERPYRGGMPFDRAAHEQLLRQRSAHFALEKAVSLLALRARTEKEIRDSLLQNAYPAHAVESVMEKLRQAGYLSDSEFAGQWAAARSAKGMGSRRIGMELRRKGVDADTIQSALDAIDEDELFASAVQAAQRAARGKNLAVPEGRQKALAALVRRGYDFSLAKRALAEVAKGNASEE